MTYEVKLDVFEGPFQLLLTLIAEQRLDVCDVPIARLTEDYLAHIEHMDRADLEVTTEFLVVAATLLALKAKALLPSPADDRATSSKTRSSATCSSRDCSRSRRSGRSGDHLAALLIAGDRRFPAEAVAGRRSASISFPVLADISAADLARTLIDVGPGHDAHGRHVQDRRRPGLDAGSRR